MSDQCATAERTLDEFRAAARAWLERELPAFKKNYPGDRYDPFSLSVRRAWEDHYCKAGWSGLCWPKRYGGQELPLEYYIAFIEEYARAGCPQHCNGLGHGILGPMLLLHGTEEQKQRFIPPLIRNEEGWCQGYSEPQAGSDLAGIKTTARRDGDDFVINGHKIWTSHAQFADYCFLLARSDPESVKHKGLSFFLVDLKSPGVRVEPIAQITGEDEFCEVFYEDVRVPAANIVGGENNGWAMAMAAANIERGTFFVPRQVTLAAEVARIWALASEKFGDPTLASQPIWRKRLVDLSVRANSLRLVARQTLERTLAGQPDGPESSYSKLLFSETWQMLYLASVELLGDRARLGPAGDPELPETPWLRQYLFTKAITLAGGTSEIHRNIISERMLGLPRHSSNAVRR